MRGKRSGSSGTEPARATPASSVQSTLAILRPAFCTLANRPHHWAEHCWRCCGASFASIRKPVTVRMSSIGLKGFGTLASAPARSPASRSRSRAIAVHHHRPLRQSGFAFSRWQTWKPSSSPGITKSRMIRFGCTICATAWPRSPYEASKISWHSGASAQRPADQLQPKPIADQHFVQISGPVDLELKAQSHVACLAAILQRLDPARGNQQPAGECRGHCQPASRRPRYRPTRAGSHAGLGPVRQRNRPRPEHHTRTVCSSSARARFMFAVPRR